MRTRRVQVLSVLAVTGFGLAGCSSEDVTEKVAEQAIEEQLEEQGQGGVDVDLGDGEIRVEGSDGETVINVDEDGGKTVISTPEGAIEIAEGADLPDGFPSNIPLPDGLTTNYSQVTPSADGDSFMVGGVIDRPFDEVADAYVAQLESAGFTQQQLTTTADGAFFTYGDAEHMVSGVIAAESTGSSRTAFNITVTPPTG